MATPENPLEFRETAVHFRSVEPLRSKKRRVPAAIPPPIHTGIATMGTTRGDFGKRRAISSKWIGRIRPDAHILGSSKFLRSTMPV